MMNKDLTEFTAQVWAGEMPEVVDASGSRDHICLGDLRSLGWSSKETTRNSMFWVYTGPNSIRVNGKELRTGDCTEEIDMDWS